MLEIEEILRRTEQGVTEPFLCRASDNALYYVKGRNIGVRDLICEWLSANLASDFGLPIAGFDILKLPEALRLYTQLGKSIGGEYAFGSRQAVHAQEYQWSHVPKTPIELQEDLLIFDWWVHNTDRQLSEYGGNPNLLWDTTTSSLIVIDHNQAFDLNFDHYAFTEGHAFRDKIPGLFFNPQKRRYYQAKMQSALEVWDRATHAIPNEWLYLDEEQTMPISFNLGEAYSALTRFDQVEFWNLKS